MAAAITECNLMPYKKRISKIENESLIMYLLIIESFDETDAFVH